MMILRTSAAAALLVLAACASGGEMYPINAPARDASDVPPEFVSPSAAPVEGCRNPMTDPRDGTHVRLVRSQGGTVGDYQVPAGRYGVGADELLRLECGTGRVVGVVPVRG
ncbi:hypothetical protein [Longimicrobium sp.]|uniref:hypothetical protein n=1 Tax=Longimicrobium sp. TaxID=2029185 RepID=UPI002E30BC07|nr:hypothetical protein [Longimicrobium sp.]